jgi:hypothetical protein
MSGERLSWDQIKQRYDEQWVELIDCDWPDSMPWPKSGVVRVHSPNRKEFWRLANAATPIPEYSASLFVRPPDPPAVIRNNPRLGGLWVVFT